MLAGSERHKFSTALLRTGKDVFGDEFLGPAHDRIGDFQCFATSSLWIMPLAGVRGEEGCAGCD